MQNLVSFKKQVANFAEQYLTINYQSLTEYACYCPFHSNTDSPSFFVNKGTGLYHCFNPDCGKKGNFHSLVKHITGKDIVLDAQVSESELDAAIRDIDKTTEENIEFDVALEKITINYENEEEVAKLQYLIDRGFHPAVLQHFEVTYSAKQQRIVIPLRDETYKVVGFIGRTTDPDVKMRYMYSEGLPKSSILFNLNNAKHYPNVFVTEGSLDCIKVHQAGFPNVVSTLGASLATHQIELLNKYFNEITILSDNDAAGESMKKAIMNSCSRKTIYSVIYPEGKKDPGECTENEIREMISGRIDILTELFNL